ncbi:uncharacterized protein RHOBADRAFT_66549 [Rhodotorula graminis WP1]|uniref:F-box domain-containing protein n=1 Tax=Rhodotorula graminis (strain WP1) TaxID=578459 RepID=A0A194S0X9_RHOGW|nr:uncharacterized protein RHOBADRAFT_66549 [Rhodotorula graminis WP1]KPV74189.1 hypothetical protein RHOBADRAFT_66549 [Rhodotorula graminis WP1]
MAFWVGKHLETYPHLFKHVESMSVSLSYLSIARADDESQDVVASCPRLSRLELRVDRQAGSYLQALQDKTDLTKLVEVVIQTVDMSWQSWHHYATFDRLVSANLVFAFVRACPNVRRFAYIGHQEIVNETADVPRGRRIKLDELTLDIKDTKLDSETGRRSSSIRSRFLLQFDLGRLVTFKAHVNLRDGDNLAALDRMVNLETLRLVDDHGLDVAALDALGARLVRLVKLRDVDLSAAPEVECPTSPAVLKAVERLFKALPATVERLSLSVPLPEPLAEALLEGSPGLEHFLSHVYDPLDVRPEASEMHWRRTVYVSGDEMEQLDVEDNESL